MKMTRTKFLKHLVRHFYSITILLALIILIIIQLKKPAIQNTSSGMIERPDDKSDKNILISPSLTSNNNEHFTLDNTKSYSAIIYTQKGRVVVELDTKKAPITVRNFVTLAKNMYYDQTPIYPVEQGFMMQDEGPNGDSSGGPGYRFEEDPFTGEYTKENVLVSNPSPNSNRRQFFILLKNTPMREYFVEFGKVTAGIDVIKTIQNTSIDKPFTIQSIEIVEK